MNLIVDNLEAVQSGKEREVKFLLEAAVERHQNGQLAAANLIYQEIRKIDPDNINALQLSGLLAYQVQQYDASISLLSRTSLQDMPSQPQTTHVLIYLRRTGRPKLETDISLINYCHRG